MPRPINEEKLIAQEEKTLETIEDTLKKLDKERKQLARQRKKGMSKRLSTLGQVCHDLFPEHLTKDIVRLLRTASWHEDGHAMINTPSPTSKQSSMEKRVKLQKVVASGSTEADAMEFASHSPAEEVAE